MKSLLAFLTGLFVVFLSACYPKMPAECKATGFFDLPTDEQTAQFRSFPIEKQVQLFTCSYRYIHPFHTPFAFDIAERGDAAVLFLTDKLKTERDANNLGAIIYILEIMFKYGDNLHNREAASYAIRQAIPEMQCSTSKSWLQN